MSERPRRGDVVYLDALGGFTYVAERGPRPEATGCWTIWDPSGEEFLVCRDPERDYTLRWAVHDDGRRRAWRLISVD